MSERPSDRWISMFWSVLLHGGIIGLLWFGFYRFAKPPKPEPLAPAIDALVLDSKTLAAIPAARRAPPEPAPPPPEPVPETPPPTPEPNPQEVAQQELEQKQKKEQEEKQLAEQTRLADEKRIADERAEAERKQQEEEAQRKAKEEAERQAKEAAEAKKKEEERKEEAKRLAEEKRKAEETRQEAERQAELQKSLEAEERAMALRSSGAMASWIQQITARIQRAWIKPPSARAGIDCTLLVTQVPGGEVVSVRVAACNGDQAVRESIEAAAYRASPLPPPPDPAMFDRNLEIRFRPVD